MQTLKNSTQVFFTRKQVDQHNLEKNILDYNKTGQFSQPRKSLDLEESTMTGVGGRSKQ